MHEHQFAYSPYQSSFSPEGADKESLCNNEKFLWSLQFVIMFLYLVTLLRDAGVISPEFALLISVLRRAV